MIRGLEEGKTLELPAVKRLNQRHLRLELFKILVRKCEAIFVRKRYKEQW